MGHANHPPRVEFSLLGIGCRTPPRPSHVLVLGELTKKYDNAGGVVLGFWGESGLASKVLPTKTWQSSYEKHCTNACHRNAIWTDYEILGKCIYRHQKEVGPNEVFHKGASLPETKTSTQFGICLYFVRPHFPSPYFRCPGNIRFSAVQTSFLPKAVLRNNEKTALQHSVLLKEPGCWKGFVFRKGAVREEKSVHNHHRKESFWRTFLASKKTFPGRWWIQKPYKNQENHIHHRNLSSVDPIFFCKEKFCTGAGRCAVSFSQAARCFTLEATKTTDP